MFLPKNPPGDRPIFAPADLILSSDHVCLFVGGGISESSDAGVVRVGYMDKQMSFAQSEYAGKKKVTRRERFLGEME